MELVADGSVPARVRLLHSAVCGPKLALRQAASGALGRLGLRPNLASFPDVAVTEREDARLLRSTLLVLLRQGFRKKHRWSSAVVRERLLVVPELARVVRQVVWGGYTGDDFDSAFVIDEGHLPIDVELEEVPWPGTVGLAWSAELGADVERWQGYFADHDIIDQLAQLHTGAKEGEELRELILKVDTMAAVALGRRMRPDDVWAAVQDLLDTPNDEVLRHTLDVCKGIRLRAAIPHFEANLDHPTWVIARTAAEAIRTMGVDELLPVVAQHALDGHTECLSCMGNWAKKRGTKVILPRLSHEDWRVRAAAAMASATVGSVKPIRKALVELAANDPHPRVRLEAVIAGGARYARIDGDALRWVREQFPDDPRLDAAEQQIPGLGQL